MSPVSSFSSRQAAWMDLPGSTWPAGWLKRRWPAISSSTSKKRPASAPGGHGEAGGQRWVIAHKDSFVLLALPGGGARCRSAVAFIQRAWCEPGRRAVVRPPLRLAGARVCPAAVPPLGGSWICWPGGAGHCGQCPRLWRDARGLPVWRLVVARVPARGRQGAVLPAPAHRGSTPMA